MRYQSVKAERGGSAILARFKTEDLLDQAKDIIRKDFVSLVRADVDSENGGFAMRLTMSDQAIRDIEDYAVSQNLTTLRNRVNELGVSEPIVQRQGRNRVVVELPGVQDTAEAKRIIGKTANLEFIEGILGCRHNDLTCFDLCHQSVHFLQDCFGNVLAGSGRDSHTVVFQIVNYGLAPGKLTIHDSSR